MERGVCVWHQHLMLMLGFLTGVGAALADGNVGWWVAGCFAAHAGLWLLNLWLVWRAPR